jgi:hypothetical protein
MEGAGIALLLIILAAGTMTFIVGNRLLALARKNHELKTRILSELETISRRLDDLAARKTEVKSESPPS